MKYERSQLRLLENASGKEQVVCSECVTDKDWDGVSSPKQIVRTGEMDKLAIYFCDRCGKRVRPKE